MDKHHVYLASKPRYEILDGLRGVAALIVVAFHLLETYSHGYLHQIINHGYLAVDFFFALSGFVIGYAYDDRWDRMSTWNFFKRRLVRLHPMAIFGSFVGLLLFYSGASNAFPLIDQTPWWMALLIFLWCCTMIPVGQRFDIRGWQETNPLDGPAWSLQWEYLGNILYALIFRHLNRFWLSLFVALFAILTVNITMSMDLCGVAGRERMFCVIGGWSLAPDQLVIGAGRLLYPFFMGLLLSRLHWMVRIRGGFWWCSLSIILLLTMPRMGGTEAGWMNGIYESIVILILFPLIVSAGAGSRVTDHRTQAVCRFSGEISYPIYITHYPFVYMQMAWVERHHDAPLGQHILFNAGIYIAALLTAYAAYKLYDLPVREWLRSKLFAPIGKAA
ncbi:MAG: acyltransferase [Prevotella sp.]|nr:acyltransferase [Prevotella sp.]